MNSTILTQKEQELLENMSLYLQLNTLLYRYPT